MRTRREIFLWVSLGALLLLFFILEITIGTTAIPVAEALEQLFFADSESSQLHNIIRQVRLPRALTAALAGSALAIGGLLMQTLFRNPLAGPGVLGISSGAGFGVALVVLAGGSTAVLYNLGIGQNFSIALAAGLGSILVLAILLLVSARVRDNVVLLIFGLMLGYAVSGLNQILQNAADSDQIRNFVVWGLGSFANTQLSHVGIVAGVFVISILLILGIVRHLDLLLLGENYALTSGVPLRKTKWIIILSTGLLTGIVVAFCGPIAFVGLAVPHLSRAIFRTTLHRTLLPACLLLGAILCMGCDLANKLMLDSLALPINALTALVGAPTAIYILLKSFSLRGSL